MIFKISIGIIGTLLFLCNPLITHGFFSFETNNGTCNAGTFWSPTKCLLCFCWSSGSSLCRVISTCNSDSTSTTTTMGPLTSTSTTQNSISSTTSKIGSSTTPSFSASTPKTIFPILLPSTSTKTPI